MTITHGSRPRATSDQHLASAPWSQPESAAPEYQITWTDPVTGARGYLVIDSLVGGLATGGTRMRPGCTMREVSDLARGMATKTAAFELPVGGAKGGIDFDPKDPRATEVLERFYAAMLPWLERHWVTAEDLGVPPHVLDEVFARLGLDHSFHAAIGRAPDPQRTLRRVQEGLAARNADGLLLAEVIGGYGVAQACLGAIKAFGWDHQETTVAIQGIGTMGGGAAWYLHRAGARVVAVADAAGTLRRSAGLDIPDLLDRRDEYGEIDRTGLPEDVEQLPREAVLATAADVLVPAAISYAINTDNARDVQARVVVEAANSATTPEAEAYLTAHDIPVVPDFVANAGAAAWAWWLLQGQVGSDAEDSYDRLRAEMQPKVARLLTEWHATRTSPRQTAQSFAASNRRALAGARIQIP
ncbi:MAG TPA: Glu/Leu/Phe/Val dehydrogenase dimerization domain-containing protein [Actinomycetaceae bacterium]|nr:Glu/Leu/Phe/Val dehydrogenase dimerization domain-containing protein [Actinomycetaceae bacterium]